MLPGITIREDEKIVRVLAALKRPASGPPSPQLSPGPGPGPGPGQRAR